ncbi:hypothetical protein [Streptomyces sp. Ncost-T10-10d]|uniref:hypothetical protein n=1 Tax=Streptomyces sp. Ncost-T10-10d TaxID=1839774 RepID=UPI00081E7F7F|nr:hypothetical protein [Streptomyces sp. Ncost-T10-10d]SCF95125.1 hypothetical protein GA0115254_1266171 [Streptomyces sp. Ncost-T10-10d]
MLTEACARAGFRPWKITGIAEWTGKFGHVAAGLGVALVPSLAAWAVLAGLSLCRLGDPARCRTVPDPAGTAGPDGVSESGRGPLIVEALADRRGVSPGPFLRMAVWAELDCPVASELAADRSPTCAIAR